MSDRDSIIEVQWRFVVLFINDIRHSLHCIILNYNAMRPHLIIPTYAFFPDTRVKMMKRPITKMKRKEPNAPA